jgi:hypothetical protein
MLIETSGLRDRSCRSNKRDADENETGEELLGHVREIISSHGYSANHHQQTVVDSQGESRSGMDQEHATTSK